MMAGLGEGWVGGFPELWSEQRFLSKETSYLMAIKPWTRTYRPEVRKKNGRKMNIEP